MHVMSHISAKFVTKMYENTEVK